MQDVKQKVGISGARGSFSERAAGQFMKEVGDVAWEPNYLVSVEGVLSALDAGTIDLGIFPIENSNGGIVIEAVHAMSRHLFSIERIFEIDVHHCLLAKKGAHASAIKHITSHDQALKQCRMYLKRRWHGVELTEYADTAKAAADLASGVLSEDTAVIAPKHCAALYGLDVLEESIQDLKFNFTSFIAARK